MEAELEVTAVEVMWDGKVEVAVEGEDLPNNFFTTCLGERDVDDGGLAPEFDIFDSESRLASLCAAKEVEM